MIKLFSGHRKQNEKTGSHISTDTIEESIRSDDRTIRVSGYAAKLALLAGKSESEVSEVYDFAMNHNAVEILPEDNTPEAAKILVVADAYDLMTRPNSFRDPLPQDMVREKFVSESGTVYDPLYARLMVRIIDEDPEYQTKTENASMESLTDDITCDEYRSMVSCGIRITTDVTCIRFTCEPTISPDEGFWAPAVVLFDSQDRHVHHTASSVDATRYIEYGEMWFDGHTNNASARNMKTVVTEEDTGNDYEIESVKAGDHIRVRCRHAGICTEVTAALQDNSRFAYVGLTGENCHISDINITTLGPVDESDKIVRIADEVSYIERLESDVPNVQVDGYRLAATAGILIKDALTIEFHTMSLPAANLVWHCPYIVLFSSADGTVDGDDYREYALIRLDGEIRDDGVWSSNDKVAVQGDDFAGWEEWKKINQKGYECRLEFRRIGQRIITRSVNHGITIRNTTHIMDKEHINDVRVAITGDLVALTDIRID